MIRLKHVTIRRANFKLGIGSTYWHLHTYFSARQVHITSIKSKLKHDKKDGHIRYHLFLLLYFRVVVFKNTSNHKGRNKNSILINPVHGNQFANKIFRG